MNINRYFNKKQACEYFGVCNNTLDKWMNLGLPHYRIGGRLLFKAEELDAWIKEFEIRL